MVRLPGHVLPALATAKRIPPADAHSAAVEENQPLTLTIVIKRDKQAGLPEWSYHGSDRSVPDVVAVADAKIAPTVCEADAGGCPTGLAYGGTRLSTPVWATFTAMLNQALGHPLGLLNLHSIRLPAQVPSIPPRAWGPTRRMSV